MKTSAIQVVKKTIEPGDVVKGYVTDFGEGVILKVDDVVGTNLLSNCFKPGKCTCGVNLKTGAIKCISFQREKTLLKPVNSGNIFESK